MLRRSMTDAERVAWSIVRNRYLAHWKFRRQHRAAAFILDFYSPRLRLAIELDGDPHFTENGLRYDDFRDQTLAGLGIRVIHYENRRLADAATVTRELELLCEERARELGL